MARFRTGKLRLLYVLALAQLVGGPIVLLQVTLLCKLTLNEAPRMHMAEAVVSAWHSDEFQAAITAGARHGETQTPLPSRDPKGTPDKSKPPAVPWKCEPLALIVHAVTCEIVTRERIWTPAWPQAPPGPPPRLG